MKEKTKGGSPQALYDSYIKDLIFQENFNPYSKSKKEGQSQFEKSSL